MIKVESVSGSFFAKKDDFHNFFSKGYGVDCGKRYELGLYEVFFLTEKGKIEVFRNGKKLDFEDISRMRGFLMKDYVVYRDLRNRGYVVRSGLKYGFVFRVYDKGVKEGVGHSLWFVEPIGEREKVGMRDFTGRVRIAHNARKKVLLAIVDDEGSVTYIETDWKRL